MKRFIKCLACITAANLSFFCVIPTENYLETQICASYTDGYDINTGFDLTEFKNDLQHNEEALLESGNHENALTYSNNILTKLDELATDYNILQCRYFCDNSDMDLFYTLQTCASDLYGAQNAFTDFIRELGEKECFTDLTDLYKISQNVNIDFARNQSQLISDYYNCSDPEKMSDIYLRLTRLRCSEAKDNNYIAYPDMIYSTVYQRDYSPQNIDQINDSVQKLISVLKTFNLKTSDNNSIDTQMSPDETMSFFESGLSPFSEEIKSVYSYATQNNLFSLVSGENISNGAFTAYLYKYNEPRCVIGYNGNKNDISDLTRQFGVFLSKYYKDCNCKYYTDKCDNNDIEQTISNYFRLIYDQRNETEYKKTISQIIESLINSYVINEFETYAYSEPDLTAEKLSHKYCEIRKNAGFSYGDEQDSDSDWVYIENLYTTPFLMTGNMTASLNALELFNVLETEGPDKASIIFDEFVTSTRDNTMTQLINSTGIHSCLVSDDINELAVRLKSELSEISDPDDSSKTGDINNDSYVNAVDLVILKKIILCSISDNTLSEYGYSLYNADLNHDDYINIFDLHRLMSLILTNSTDK
ncbi:MAG: dockerin type I domain-containing protein [Oscillospiraceae bacterium]|nr:dockerin type I domain-containing protein [Oscillospiraceae bacterium]